MAKKSARKTTPPAASGGNQLKPWQRQALTHLSIVLLFFFVVIGYFSPLFNNQQLDWHDIKHFQGMAKESVDFREKAANDPEFAKLHGSEPLWVSTLFSGMPAFQTSIKYSGDLLTPITKFLWFGLPRPANYIFLSFLGFYFLLLMLRVNPWLSGIGAAAFALSSYFFIILTVGHTSKALAIAYFAPVLAGVLLTYRGKILLGSAVTAFCLALQIHANHYQVTYYLAITLLLLGIAFAVDAFREKALPQFAKASGALLIAALIGLMPNVGKLWTTSQYAEYTMRGKAELAEDLTDKDDGLDKGYALEYSYGIMETFTLMIPNFQGGPSVVDISDRDLQRKFNGATRLPAYWGNQRYTAGPVYVGAIICFLFVLGLVLVEGRIKWWLIAITVLSIMLAWGKNFLLLTDLFFYYFPVYNKFRAVTMFLVVAEVAMPLLGILGLQRFLDQEVSVGKKKNALYIALGVTGGLALLFALIGPSMFSFLKEGEDFNQLLVEWRQGLMRADAFRSLGFILGGGLVLWLSLEKKIQAPALYGGLAVLILLDMIPVNLRYLNKDDYLSTRRYEAIFDPTPADLEILKDTDPNYRVMNLAAQEGPFNDAITSYHHKSVGGYHAAKLRRYQDVISRHLSPEIQMLSQSLQQAQQSQSMEVVNQGLAQMQVFNMLNTRYYILNAQGAPLQNSFAMGNVWFANEIRRVSTPDDEINALREVDLTRTAVIDQSIDEGRFGKQVEGFQPRRDSTARIYQTEFAANRIVYESKAQSEQLAVFSEVYYNGEKGWNAYLDGEKVPHLRANYILRAIRIPAGEHVIEFRFEPQAYFVGNTLSLIGSLLVILILLGALAWEYRTNWSKQEESA